MKKVFIEDLPKKYHRGIECIDWEKSKGLFVNFIYDDKCGKIKIVNFDVKNRSIDVEYNNIKTSIKYYNFVQNNIGRVIGVDAHSGVVTNGVNDIPTTAPWMVDYFQGGYEEAKLYSTGSNKKVDFVCPYCSNVKKMEIYRLYNEKHLSCNCRDTISYPNKFMYNCLKQIGVDFINEYIPEWISPKRYDFYIPSKSLIIEMDGSLGHGKRSYGRDGKETLYIDKYKDNKAKIHNIKVIRIDSRKSEKEYISNNITKSLEKYFDFSMVNWNECDMYALNNIVKQVCNSYENNECSINQIKKIFGLSNTTIRNYLKKGRVHGWTCYNENIARKEALERTKNTMKDKYSKMIYVYDTNGNFIREYSSLHDVQANSMDDFGIFLSYSSVSACCNGKLNSYKGLIFTHEKEKINLDCDMRIYNRKVSLFDLNMRFICEYASISEACRRTGISRSTIMRSCKGEIRKPRKYIWIYSDKIAS